MVSSENGNKYLGM